MNAVQPTQQVYCSQQVHHSQPQLIYHMQNIMQNNSNFDGQYEQQIEDHFPIFYQQMKWTYGKC